MRASILLAALVVAACSTPQRVTVAPAVPVLDADEPPPNAANPPVGGTALPVDGTVAANLAAAPSLATFARLFAAAGIRMAPGTTVFAPTEEAFGRLAPGTVDALLRPENRATLSKFVALHIVATRLSSAALIRRVVSGSGRATLTSTAGEPLLLTVTGSVITLTDAGGNKSYVEIADVRETDGVIHVVNGVLVPRLN